MGKNLTWAGSATEKHLQISRQGGFSQQAQPTLRALHYPEASAALTVITVLWNVRQKTWFEVECHDMGIWENI